MVIINRPLLPHIKPIQDLYVLRPILKETEELGAEVLYTDKAQEAVQMMQINVVLDHQLIEMLGTLEPQEANIQQLEQN